MKYDRKGLSPMLRMRRRGTTSFYRWWYPVTVCCAVSPPQTNVVNKYTHTAHWKYMKHFRRFAGKTM